MEIRNAKIDGGDAFDWGRTSADYARFRDIYPPEFYEHILRRNCGTAGQRMLDLGTGTGVLPRNLVRHLDGDGYLRKPGCQGTGAIRRHAH